MVPLATFAKAAWTLGPPQLTRYNGYPSFNLEGQAAPSYSSGEAMQAMEQLMQGLPEASPTSGPASPSKNACPAPRRRRCSPSRC